MSIKEEKKTIGEGLYNDLTIKCYVGYDEDGDKIFSVNEGPNVEVGFAKPSKPD